MDQNLDIEQEVTAQNGTTKKFRYVKGESKARKFFRVVFGSALGFLLASIILSIFSLLLLVGIVASIVNDDKVGDVAAVEAGAAALLVADVNDVTAGAIVQACATPGVAAVGGGVLDVCGFCFGPSGEDDVGDVLRPCVCPRRHGSEHGKQQRHRCACQ